MKIPKSAAASLHLQCHDQVTLGRRNGGGSLGWKLLQGASAGAGSTEARVCRVLGGLLRAWGKVGLQGQEGSVSLGGVFCILV